MIDFDDETRGLLRAALGEALGGFAAKRFPAEDKAAVQVCLQLLDNPESFTLTGEDARLLIKVLNFALEELGPEEFHTVTGFEFDFGVATLGDLQDLIGSPNCNMGK